jgi:hypothetical protein
MNIFDGIAGLWFLVQSFHMTLFLRIFPAEELGCLWKPNRCKRNKRKIKEVMYVE